MRVAPEYRDKVSLRYWKPPLVLAAIIVDRVYLANGSELIITCGDEGKHGRQSRHFIGHAFDARTRHLEPDLVSVIVMQCKERLGRDFDVVLEPDHLHIEFDPKEQLS
jgi:hypothetical protein